MRYVGRRKIL
jgi:hypothetical protein